MFGIELFAGAGGLSLGARRAGVEVIGAIEKAESASDTYAKNHPKVHLLQDDISVIDPMTFNAPKKGLVVFGGPPCQGFSTSNQKNRSLSNEGNWLFSEFLRFTEVLAPDIVLFENVAGITHTANGFFLNELVSRLEALGYNISHAVLNASRFGVPQNRSRFFCVGSKIGPLHLPEGCVDECDAVTVKDAIEDLPKLSVGNLDDRLPYRAVPKSKYAKRLRSRAKTCTGHLVTNNAPHIVERYKHVPQGGNWADIPSELMNTYRDVRRCHTGIYRRLRYDSPSIVLGNFRKNMLIHPNEDRGLSVREAARIQSFPDSYKFSGSIGQQQQQVGNAVPPMLAEAVFSSIFRQLGS